MRVGAGFFLWLTLISSFTQNLAGNEWSPSEADPKPSSRAPYILRKVFGDIPQGLPKILGVTPGTPRQKIPVAELGKEVSQGRGPMSYLRNVADRANVMFVFEGYEEEALLHHVTITIYESFRLTRKTLTRHLTHIYGDIDTDSRRESDGVLATWQSGAIALRHFPVAHFFEVTLSPPAGSSAPH